MSQQPKTETDRLANIIQVLQLGHKTGRLVAERNEGPDVEQGFITFVNGQVSQASINQQQGSDALHQLRSWGHCRFAFSPERYTGITGPLPAIPSPRRPGSNGFTPPARVTGRTGPLYAPAIVANGTTRQPEGGRVPTAWLTIPYRTRQIEEGMRLIEQMGLSRTHRRLFLLIDGRRTIKELIRLMMHEPEDVLKLLQDLARAGVIQT